MRKALVIGIDHYPQMPLLNCVDDANRIAELLATNGDGAPNFSVRRLTSLDSDVGVAELGDAIADLFRGDADMALLYFAGHGVLNPETNAGYIVSKDGHRGAWGVSLSEILNLANNAHPRIKSSIIILDCCHSGYAGEVAGLGRSEASVIGSGVTILTASHRQGAADDGTGQGLFTGILLDGLDGAASDIRGNITPAALYSHVDQTLGAWEQRPIYKANVQTFVSLRQVEPRVPLDTLRRLPTFFPEPGSVYSLDPTCEPDRGDVPDAVRTMPIDPDRVAVYRALQTCNRHGLVVPVDAAHMYEAAVRSKGCRLTATGTHYRKLAEMKRL